MKFEIGKWYKVDVTEKYIGSTLPSYWLVIGKEECELANGINRFPDSYCAECDGYVNIIGRKGRICPANFIGKRTIEELK